MGRATQFVEFINMKRLQDKAPINIYYRTRLTHIGITESRKQLRKQYLRRINNG